MDKLLNLNCTCTPKTGYLQDKNLQGKSLSELLFTSKIFEEGTVPRFPPN